MRSRFVLALILALTLGLLLFSLTSGQVAVRALARNCGVIGGISFVALYLVAGARRFVFPAIRDRYRTPEEQAARQSLLHALRDIGLPTNDETGRGWAQRWNDDYPQTKSLAATVAHSPETATDRGHSAPA